MCLSNKTHQGMDLAVNLQFSDFNKPHNIATHLGKMPKMEDQIRI